MVDFENLMVLVFFVFFPLLYLSGICDQVLSARAEKSAKIDASLATVRFPIDVFGRRVTGKSQLKLLELLATQSFVTRSRIDGHLGIKDASVLIRRLVRSGGWNILSYHHRVSRAVGEPLRRRPCYALTVGDQALASEIIRMVKLGKVPGSSHWQT